jgi:hypothetical protein
LPLLPCFVLAVKRTWSPLLTSLPPSAVIGLSLVAKVLLYQEVLPLLL